MTISPLSNLWRVRRWACVACLMVFALSLSPSRARAEDYASPTLLNLIHTLVRFGAVSLDDPDVINEYAQIAECDLYLEYYRDDFKWHEIQRLLRQKLLDGVATYPLGYYVDMTLQLDRYDFDEKVYRFTELTMPKNANVFSIHDKSAGCGNREIRIWPRSFPLVIDRPVTMVGLPLFEGDAKTLLKRMDDAGNKDHLVFARYKLRVTRVDTYARGRNEKGQLSGALKHDSKNGTIDAHLDAVDFYEDEARTKLIYVYRP